MISRTPFDPKQCTPMQKSLLIFIPLLLVFTGCERKPEKLIISFTFLEADKISGYVASADFEVEADRVSGPMLCRRIWSTEKMEENDQRSSEDLAFIPARVDDGFAGKSNHHQASGGEVLFYDDQTDTFETIGHYEEGIPPLEAREIAEEALVDFLPETEFRDWLTRWKAGPLYNNLEIIEIVELGPGETMHLKIERPEPTWVGYYVEKAKEVGQDPGTIRMLVPDSESTTGGSPKIVSLIMPTNGVLEFGLENATKVRTKLAIFIKPEEAI